jgi:hypothetical protein
MRVDEYRARAERYEDAVKRFRSSGAKEVYENLARQLRQLANQAESGERTTEAT